jgi:hypothetical protein
LNIVAVDVRTPVLTTRAYVRIEGSVLLFVTNMIPGRSTIVAFALMACGLGGCGTINSNLAAGMGDYVPQWAGGLPPDAPPRPGTAKYDAYMQERERLRLLPAAERERERARASEASPESPPQDDVQ